MFGVNVTDLNLGVQINPVKQPIQRNSVGSEHVSHRWTSTFDNHFDYCLIVVKDIQHSTGTRMRFGMTLVCLIGMELCMFGNNCRRFPHGSLLGPSVLFGAELKYFNHQIPESESGNTVHAYTCIERNYFSFRRTV